MLPGFHPGSWRSRPSRPTTHKKDAQDASRGACQGLPCGRPLLPCVMPRPRSVIMAQITNLVRKTCWYGARTQQNREKSRKNQLGRLLTGVHTILNSVLSSADASIRVSGCTYNRLEYFGGFWKSCTYERTRPLRPPSSGYIALWCGRQFFCTLLQSECGEIAWTKRTQFKRLENKNKSAI